VNPEPPPGHPFGLRYYLPEEVETLLQRAGLQSQGRFDVEGQLAPADGNDGQFEFYLARKGVQ
jgi:hypothetical protein